MRRDLPSGAVTLLFSDVEGSTKLLHEVGPEAYAEKLAEHRRVVRVACTAQSGVEVDTQGDAFFLAFPTATEAVEAAQAITEALAPGPVALRIGLHTGTPLLTDEGYVGEDVHFAARVAASAHGGQVVFSQTTRSLLDDRYPLVDLGEHRLKDISEPVAIFQLGIESFPPLKTISNTNIPRPASSFVGRERELSELLARIQAGARLVTLTGPGGSGKTRLALEAATSLVPEYKAGVFWVGLAALRDAALVTGTIAQTLGAKDGLAEHIGEREMLLLLDNLEQVIEAAPELSRLLQGCPNLTLLVTSRELLRVQGEIEYPVPALANTEAVSLFCERAQTEASEVIGELCQRLDNLPLAVELAAARTRALSPAQILERLSQRLDLLKGGRDAVPRQQTLRATIEWSYDLLQSEEQQLFARLSVFAGGCTLEAAEDVCDADLDTVASLVDKSLLRYTNERFWMLETIREFAADQLEGSGDSEVTRCRQAEYFLALAEQLFDEFAEARELSGFIRFGEEQENFRVALASFLERGREEALQLVQRLWVTWLSRGQLDEGERWTKLALEGTAAGSARLRAWMAGMLGEFARFRGEHQRAVEIKAEALELTRALGMDRETKALLCDIAESLAVLGELERARPLVAEALELEQRETDPRPPGTSLVRARGAAAELAMFEHRYHDAKRWYAEIFDAVAPLKQEKTSLYVWTLTAFGECLRRLGDRDGAEGHFREALLLALEARVLTWVPEALEAVAALAEARSPGRAAVLLGSAVSLRSETGLVISDPSEHHVIEQSVRGKLDAAAFESAFAEGRAKSVDEGVAYALESLDA
jgi:predicted ATPase/class 3 adenylate cyclase